MSDNIMSEEDLAELEAMMNDEDVIEEPQKQELPEEVESVVETADIEKPKPVEKKKAPRKQANKELLDPAEVKRDLAFNENTINEAFMSQASLYVHYATVAHQLMHQYDAEKAQLEILESKIDDEIRTEAAESKSKITEAALGKQIKLDARYDAKQKRVLDAKMKANLAKDVLESFKQRRDMLVQMGADLREGMKGELRMKAIEGERASKIDNARKIVGA